MKGPCQCNYKRLLSGTQFGGSSKIYQLPFRKYHGRAADIGGCCGIAGDKGHHSHRGDAKDFPHRACRGGGGDAIFSIIVHSVHIVQIEKSMHRIHISIGFRDPPI